MPPVLPKVINFAGEHAHYLQVCQKQYILHGCTPNASVLPKVINSARAHTPCPQCCQKQWRRRPLPGLVSAAAASLRSMRHPGSRWPSQLAVISLPRTQSGRLLVHGETQCVGLRCHRSPALHYPGPPRRTAGVWLLPHGKAWAPEPSTAARRHGSGWPGWGRRTPGVRLLPHGRALAPESSIAARRPGWGGGSLWISFFSKPRILVLWKTRIREFSFCGKRESENSRFVENENREFSFCRKPEFPFCGKRESENSRFVENQNPRIPVLCRTRI